MRDHCKTAALLVAASFVALFGSATGARAECFGHCDWWWTAETYWLGNVDTPGHWDVSSFYCNYNEPDTCQCQPPGCEPSNLSARSKGWMVSIPCRPPVFRCVDSTCEWMYEDYWTYPDPSGVWNLETACTYGCHCYSPAELGLTGTPEDGDVFDVTCGP